MTHGLEKRSPSLPYEIPKVTNLLSAEEPKEQPTLTEAERQDLLLEKLS